MRRAGLTGGVRLATAGHTGRTSANSQQERVVSGRRDHLHVAWTQRSARTNGAWMARESGSRGATPALVPAAALRALGRNHTSDPDHATEA